MKLKFVILSFTLMLCGFTFAQKKVIDVAAYSQWRRADSYRLTQDGRFVLYKYVYIDNDEKNKEIGEKYYLFDYKTKKTTVLDSVSNPNFSPKGDWLTYSQGDKLYLRRMRDGKIIEWEREGTPSFERVAGHVSYTTNGGKDFVICDLNRGDSVLYAGAQRVNFYDNGTKMIYQIDRGNSIDLCYGDVKKGAKHKVLFSDKTKSLNGYYFYDAKSNGYFQIAGDTSNIKKQNLIYNFNLPTNTVELAMDKNDIKLPEPLYVDESSITKSSNRKFVTFDVYPIKPQPTIKVDKSKKDESFELELWSWNDSISQAVQAIRGYRKAKAKGDVYAYNTQTKSYYPVLKNPYSSIYTSPKADCDFMFVSDDSPYCTFGDWEHDLRSDIYLVDLRNGEKKLIKERYTHRPIWSMSGTHIIYYDSEEKAWFSVEPYTFTKKNLSAEIGHSVANESYDKPNPRPSYGTPGWSSDGKRFLIYDKYDIWVVDYTGKQPAYCYTKGYGRKNNCRLRFVNPEYSDMSIDLNKSYDLEICNFDDMSTAIATITPHGDITKNVEGDCLYRVMKSSQDNKTYLYFKQSMKDDRDLWISDSKFKKPFRVTEANPQQKDYLWGSVELVEWTMFDGKKNKGLLYLPEGYQKGKSYPAIVNFYETHTGETHIYHAPTYSSAMLDVATYLSQGYIIFMPDVYFKIGEPGKSSYNSVVSGTQALIDRGILDPKRIGLQGHSWSGYQTSYLVTKTNMFTCVNIGAPIVNMTAAYNGIREGSGMPRMFMYEDWQCRMGAPMWEIMDKFIESSPILYADKINTPVLLFHCDKDEAVSFSEGRALFLALRRLQRPAWMLNYKGEGHFVSAPAAKADWTKRMQQFFDYYLKGTDMPRWMSEGIDIYERGIDPKYDYVKNKL